MHIHKSFILLIVNQEFLSVVAGEAHSASMMLVR